MKKLVWFLPIAILVALAWGLRTRSGGGLAGTGASPTDTPAAELAPGPDSESVALPADDSGRTELAFEAAQPAPTDETIRVRVIDVLSEQPLAHASLSFSMGGQRGTSSSDSEGLVDTGLALPARGLELQARATGYSTEQLRISTDETPVTIELAPFAKLRGRVLSGETLEPVAHAELSWRRGSHPVRSLDDGSYLIAECPAGVDVALRIRAEGHGEQSFSFQLTQKSDETERDFVLQPALRVEGRVVDFLTHEVLEGAEVTGTLTDERGYFVSEVLDWRGRIGMNVSMEGYCTLYGPGRTDEPMLLPLPRTASVEGFVRGPDGAPVPGALVRVNLWERRKLGIANVENEIETPLSKLPHGWALRMEHGITDAARTDERGHYHIDGLRPWVPQIPLMVNPGEAPGGFSSETFVVPQMAPPGETTSFDITLGTPPPLDGVLSGHVTLNGKPAMTEFQWSAGEQSGVGFCEPDQPYRIELPAGTPVEVRARPVREHGIEEFLEGARATFEIEAGAQVEHDFALSFPTASISGQVLDTLDRPLDGVSVTAHADFLTTGTSDAQGAFELEVPADIPAYRLTVSGRGPTLEGVAPGTRDVRLVVDALGRVRIRALDAVSDAPLEMSFLAWRIATAGRPASDHLSSGRTGFELLTQQAPEVHGWYEVEVPAGRLEVVLLGNDGTYRPAQVPVVDVPADGLIEVELSISRGWNLELRLIGEAGPWLEEHGCLLVPVEHIDDVTLEENGVRVHPSAPLDIQSSRFVVGFQDGVAKLAGLLPGTYRFVVMPGDPLPDPATITIGENRQVVEVSWGD